MVDNVILLTSKSNHEHILASLHQLRINGQLCDVTVQVDYEGDVQEFQAHQVMLAASSGYFRKIILSPDKTQDKILLSNICSDDFSKFLEFVYTGKVEVARNKIGDVQAVAQLLDCEDLSEVCGTALGAETMEKETTASKPETLVGSCEATTERKTIEEEQPKRRPHKRTLCPLSSDKDRTLKKFKGANTMKVTKRRITKLKLKLAGRKVLQRNLYSQKEASKNKNQYNDEDVEDSEGSTEADGHEGNKDKGNQSSPEMPASDVDSWECEAELKSKDSEDPSLAKVEEQDKGKSKEVVRRTSKAQFECTRCQRTFHYEKSYSKHMRLYHGVIEDIVYRCQTCLQTFANRNNLKIHERHVHSNERLFACAACAKTFKRKKDVVRHHRQVHERNLQHICPECGKSLSSKAALLLHERIHTGTKPFECTECGSKFTQNSALKMHRRIHTGEKPFACDQCDARFTQKHMLTYHRRSHSGEKPYMCETCGKSFASKEYLRHHSNIHTGSKPYKCEQCGRGFAQRNSLHQHLKIHTGERPYSCQSCEKQFTQLNALQRHQRIHTGEKPYMCNLCERTFTDKSTLRRHTTIHGPDTPWKTYLVVLEGNVEEKKPRFPPKEKTEKPKGPRERKTSAKRNISSTAVEDAAAAKDAAATEAEDAAAADSGTTGPDDKIKTESIIVSTEEVTLHPDWAGHGTIALVSHAEITVIHTKVSPGTQIQPIVTTDSTGASVIAIDGSSFSLPVSISHNSPLSTESPPTSLTVSTLSVPVSDGLLISEIPNESSSPVPDEDASQNVVTPVSETVATSEHNHLDPDIEVVVVGNGGGTGAENEKQPTADSQSGEQRTADSAVTDLEKASPQDPV
ncbi:uncharacterized protein gzf1 [Pholidichthys leucotaenia]